MPNVWSKLLANEHKNYSRSCALLSKFCAQLMDKCLLTRSITRQLSIGSPAGNTWTVGKTWDKTLMLQDVTHSQPPYYFYQITDAFSYLSTLSTPPITTTTKYINIVRS